MIFTSHSILFGCWFYTECQLFWNWDCSMESISCSCKLAATQPCQKQALMFPVAHWKTEKNKLYLCLNKLVCFEEHQWNRKRIQTNLRRTLVCLQFCLFVVFPPTDSRPADMLTWESSLWHMEPLHKFPNQKYYSSQWHEHQIKQMWENIHVILKMRVVTSLGNILMNSQPTAHLLRRQFISLPDNDILWHCHQT